MESAHDIADNTGFRTEIERSLYQKKYYALKRRCEQVQQTNEKLVNRIHYVKKIIKRYKKERRFLMTRLDGHGDRYRDALVPAMWEEHFQPSPVVVPMPSRLDQPAAGSSTLKKAASKNDGKIGAVPRKRGKTGVKVGASKKPVNAFLMFCQHRRGSLQAECMKESNKELSQQELTKRLSQEWRNLSQEDKKVFYDKYEAEKERLEALKRMGIAATPISSSLSMPAPVKLHSS